MNILFTCAGRRGYLVEYFRHALARRPGTAGTLYAADKSPMAPALATADEAIIAPAVDDPGYPDHLLAVVGERAIDLVVPLNDLELPLMARMADELADHGARAIVSSPEIIEVAFDKVATSEFLAGIGLRGPRTHLDVATAEAAHADGRLELPAVIKPRWGTASIGLEVAEDLQELALAHELVSRRLERTIIAKASDSDPDRAVMIQERLSGPEYGLDVINDLDGNHVVTFVKEKLSMRGGETDRASTVSVPVLEQAGARIGRALGHVGNLDCDVFVDDGEPVVLEMNPRFGGGYPFSHTAGADLPAALLAWAAGEEPNNEWLTVTPGVVAAKQDVLVRVAGPEAATRRDAPLAKATNQTDRSGA